MVKFLGQDQNVNLSTNTKTRRKKKTKTCDTSPEELTSVGRHRDTI